MIAIVDWTAIKIDYITHEDSSYRKLAKKYDVPVATLFHRGKIENWADEKRQHKSNIIAKTVVEVEKDEVKRMTKLLVVTDKLLVRIERIVDKMTDEELVTDKQGLKSLTGAIRDIKEIQAVKSRIDLQEQQARIDKLRKDVERSTDETAQTVTIKIEGAEDSWVQ